MAHQTSRANQRVDRTRVRDTTHDLYRNDGTPILFSTMGGQIIQKRIEAHTVECPECSIEARFDADSEPVCPRCGILCDERGKKTLREDQIVIDAKSAGRLPEDKRNDHQ